MTSLRERLDAAKAAPAGKAMPVKAEPVKEAISAVEAAQSVKPAAGSALGRFRSTTPSKPSAEPVTQTITPPKTPEITIEAPIVPAGPSADIAQLRANLDYLAANIDQRELVGQVVRTIAVQLKSNPVLGEGMVDADFDLLIRGLRKCYMVAARNKSEKRVAKAVKSADADEIGDMMKDLGI